jgi:hypothetical protein
VRFPEFSVDCVVNRPNAGALKFILDIKKFGWFGRFVNVPSSRSRTGKKLDWSCPADRVGVK